MLLERVLPSPAIGLRDTFLLEGQGPNQEGRFTEMRLEFPEPVNKDKLQEGLDQLRSAFQNRPQPERLETFDSQLAGETQAQALYAILASWAVILVYVWFRFGNWTFGLAAVLCLVHDVLFTLGVLALCHYIHEYLPGVAGAMMIQDFKIDLRTVAALLTLVGYSINDKIVVYDRMREVRGKKPELNAAIINDSINQASSRTVLTGMSVLLVLGVLYIFGGEGIHLFAFVMLIGMIVGTYSSIYIASPLLLIFGEGHSEKTTQRRPEPEPEGALA
jgi:SecD/SecF fusion protein